MAKNIMRRFRIGEISGVDNPAQEGARVLLIKRADPDAGEEFCKATFREALESAQLEARFSRAFYDAFDGLWTINDALREALRDRYNDREETVRQYLETVADLARRAVEATAGLEKADAVPDETIIKAAILAAIDEAQGEDPMNKTQLAAAIAKFNKSGGTQAEIDAIKAAAKTLGAEDLLPATGALAKDSDSAAQLAAMQARLDKADKIGALSVEAKKFFDGLADDAARDAFLAKSADDQRAQMTASQGDDPVLYKCSDGTEIRKSHGPLALAQAKSIDTLMNRVAKAEATAGDADLRKRASTDLAKLAGTEDTKVALLKAVDSIADDATRTAVMDTLRGANNAMKGAFSRTGTTAAGGPIVKNDGPVVSDELSGPDAELDTMAKAAAPDHGGDYFKAYQAVIETPKGRELYKQSLDSAAQ
jgi:hypothetical protein